MARTKKSTQKSASHQHDPAIYAPPIEEELEEQVEEVESEAEPSADQEGEQGDDEVALVDESEEYKQGGDPNDPSDSEDENPTPPPTPEKWTITVYHHDGGNARFPTMLRMLFDRLHQVVEIDYCGRRRTHPRYLEEWDVSVHFTTDDFEHGGTVEVATQYSIATSATYAAGIDGAARRALSVLCHEEGHQAALNLWKCFPRRAFGMMHNAVTQVRDMMNPILMAQIRLNATLNTMVDETVVALRDAHNLMRAKRMGNKRLRAIINGQDPSTIEDDDEVWVSRSPSRRRTTYGFCYSSSYIV